MKRLAIKLVALTVLVCILLSSIPSVPAAASTPATLVIANDYIEATVSTKNGGFIIRTAEGDILTKADNNKDLLYRRDSFDTSFTSFLVTKDGATKEYIFGNDYSFLGLGSNNLTVTCTDTGIRAAWSVDGITFTQLLEPVLAPDSHQHGTVKISYAVQNGSGKPIEVKARLLLDTALGNQDYAYYEVAQEDIYAGALRVEKELVLDSSAGDYLPTTFFAYDNYLNPTIAAYTIRDESANAVIPYKIAFGHWNNLASTIYEFTPNPDLTFTNRYNKAYLTADSAFAMYYDLGAIAAGQQGKTVSTYYGVDSKVRVKDSDKVGITISAPPVLSLSPNKMTYLGPDPTLPSGVFDITVNVTNLARPNADTLPHIAVALFLDNGLTPLDAAGEEIWPMPTNDSPHYIELGNMAVGEVRQVTFKCNANVLANTTYRRIILRAYDMTTTDAELLLLDNLLGSTLTYVLCPGNNANPPLMTFTASAPQAIHKEGNRTITITGTGIDGLQYKDYYNLRAYLKSDRDIYFDIEKSNITRPEPGICQIMLTQPMPVGEYEFVFHWTSYGGVGDTPEGDITAPALSFFVTDDVTLQSPSYNTIAISKHGSMPNTGYSIRAFSTESEFNSYKATNEVLLTFRGNFISSVDWVGQVNSCYAISSSSKDSISINDVIELEKGNLQIYRSGSEILIEFEGDLYTTKSRNKVWQGSGALTPLTNKVDFGLLKYNERGERLFGQQPANPISIIWPGGYSMLQTIGGMAVDLRYGQFGAMYGGASNSEFKGHVLSFGGKLDLSFLMPGGPKQSQEVEREAHAENKTESVDTKEEDGVVKQDVKGYSPSDKAKAENEKNKVKPAGKVNIEDVLFGLNKGFLGFNSRAEIMLPKYFAALPAMGGVLRINTIGGYDVGVKGIAKTKKFDLEFDLRVKNAPGSNIPVPDKIYFFMGGFEPGINVDGAGAFWITGLGGGVDKLYDTIFTGGLPPLTLLLTAEYDIVKAMSGRADLALSLYGFMINMSDIKLKNTPVVVIKNAQLAIEWMPDFYMHLAAYLELYEIISGKAYIVVDNDFYELFARTTVKIPDDIKIVGGMTVGGVDLGGNNNKLWGTISALGIKLGLTYYWGGSTVHFGSGGSTSSPTYPELLGLADVPVGTTEDGSETLYLRVGSNLYALETILVESFDDTAPMLFDMSPKLTSNLSKTTHRLNLGDSEQDAAITVEFKGEGRPQNITEAQAALDVWTPGPDSSKYDLVFYDGSNPTTANANLIVNDELGITTINFTITEYLAGDWTVTSTQAADIVLYMVGAIPEVTSFTASHDVAASKLNLTWAGSLLDECKISIYATPSIGVPGTDDAGELGSLIATIGGLGASDYPEADGQSFDLSLPPNLPSGSYYVRMLVSSEDTANQSIVAAADGNAFTFEHLNSLQPQAPGGIILENVGNNMFRLNITEPPTSSYDGYLVDIFESTAEGLIPTVFVNIPFGKDEDITIGGTFISTDGQPYGLESGKVYIAKVTAYTISDNGTLDDSDDMLIQSVETTSNAATLRIPTPPTISYIPTSPHTLLSKTIQIDELTSETIAVPTFTTQDVSFTLESDTPVSGYWSLNGALMLDVLDPSSGLHEVSNVSSINVSENLADGEHSVTFSGFNAHGDSFVFNQVFAVDTSPPKLLLSSPVNGTFFAEDGHILVAGQGDADSLYTIKVNGVEVLSAQPISTDSGVFSYDLWVDPTTTSHKIEIAAIDIVGNSITHTATVLNKGLVTLNEVGLLANGSVFTNKNLILNPASNTTVQLALIGLGNNDSTFIIENERAISWNTVVTEGNASIDQDGVLVISPGSVGFAQGSLQVLDSHLLTATMTFGAEVYATEQYHLVLASTMGGTVSGLEGQYNEGAEIALSTTPAAGYQFDGWTSSHGGSFANAAQATTTFTMPANNTVVTARFTHIKSTPTYPKPQPPANRIGLYANGVLIAYIPIVDGELSASLAQSIRQHMHMGITNIDIRLLPNANGVVLLNISPEAAQALSGIEVTIHSSHGTLTIPAEVIKSLGLINQPLTIIFERLALESLNGLSSAGTEPQSDVLRIETELKGKVKVTMPLELKMPSQAQERQALLKELMVFVLHSDNTRQMIYDLSFEIDAATQVLKSISFWVDSFSSFALVKPNYQALTTTVGSRGFSVNNVERDMVACYYKNNDTMMPIRMLEDFGVNLLWDEATKTATMTYKQTSVVLTIGSTTAKINGISTPIIGASGKPVAPELAPGRTMIPLRFVSEHLGFGVTWDPSNLVTIKLKE